MTAACFLLTVWVAPLLGVDWEGECVYVADGDSITVMYHELPLKTRLYGIDAPEAGQDFGRRAKERLKEMVFGKVVRVEFMGFDKYNRALGIVHVGETSVNAQMVASGLAWVYTDFCREPHLAGWRELEDLAREEKIGLWSHKSPLPPWLFRKQPRSKAAKGGSRSDAPSESVDTATFVHSNATDRRHEK